jgi:hypothetical protein
MQNHMMCKKSRWNLHRKKIENPQNDKKKIEIFETSQYQNKRPSKFPKEKQIPYLPPCETSHEIIKDPQNNM